MRTFLFCLLSCLSWKYTCAQATLDEKMKWYALAKPTGNLFVHFDKNVYSNNETVYFTGYIVKQGRLPIQMHKVMAVALIREVDSALLMDDKFLMNNGLSFGSLKIPDSIPTGNYRFVVYTDKLINDAPSLIFTQNITIKSSLEPSFKATIKLMEQADAAATSNKILVSTATADGRFLAKPTQINYSYGHVKKSGTTDLSGQSIITLPIQSDLSDPNLYLKLKYGKDSTFMSMAIPQSKGKASVKFYPEGGNMAVGLSSNVAWEVKDQQNRPLALKAFLYKNQQVIDTIETGSYGIGKFLIEQPETGVNYSVKLIHSNLVDSSYRLPNPINNELALTLPNAIANDTLRISLKNSKKITITLLVHNFKETFSAIPFTTKNGNTILKLPLTDIPKGLTTLTILDSLDRPLAERLFFAHYNNNEKINLSTPQELYKQREKVSLKLQLNTEGNALVSIAVVQNNRLELKKMNDIESYTYLNNELNNLPINITGRPYKDLAYLEQVLLVKGWRRYTWPQLLDSKLADTLFKIDSVKVSGQVSKLKKEISEALIIGTMGSHNVSLINTTKNGIFSLTEHALLTPANKKMYVFINGAQQLSYEPKVSIFDGYAVLNQKLAKIEQKDQTILPSNLINNSELVLKNNEKSISLKEVVITSKNSTSFYNSPSSFGPNACGDYVCEYNILNCRNHGTGKSPIKGKIYASNTGSGPTVYHGCTVPDLNLFTAVKGIHLAKEFYSNDYKDANEPAFFSTLYWNYGILVSPKKENEISFYTSDITGKFRIIVQGISDRDVVYAEHFFDVK